MERLLTTHEAAERAGVGPTAIKRWADSGLLPCVRTAGGHRRFREAELAAFLAHQGPASAERSDDLAGLVEGLLLSTSAQEVEGLLLRLRGVQGAWHRTATFVGRALVELGAAWARGEISVMDEHLASERLLRALTKLAESVPVDRDAPVALLATVEGDEHLLGLALVELCLRERGLRTRWPGRSTPVEEVVTFLQRGGAQLLAVSASVTAGTPERLGAWLERVAPVCSAAGVELLLGGEGAWPDPPPLGARLRSFDELNAFLSGWQAQKVGARAAVG